MKTLASRPVDDTELRRVDAWWRAANYLSVGQIYLLANPLLREPLQAEHIKPRLLGDWGTSHGLNLVQAHLNRVIATRDLDCIYVFGPGRGGRQLAGRLLHRHLPVDRPRRGGHGSVVPPVLLPRWRPQPCRPPDPPCPPQGPLAP